MKQKDYEAPVTTVLTVLPACCLAGSTSAGLPVYDDTLIEGWEFYD